MQTSFVRIAFIRLSRESGNPGPFKFPGFRLALAVASSAGMTTRLFSEPDIPPELGPGV